MEFRRCLQHGYARRRLAGLSGEPVLMLDWLQLAAYPGMRAALAAVHVCALTVAAGKRC